MWGIIGFGFYSCRSWPPERLSEPRVLHRFRRKAELIISLLKRCVGFVDDSSATLDSPDTMAFHAKLISKKKFLRKLYADYYAFFRDLQDSLTTVPGISLELGSGGGFLKEVLPSVTTSDVHTGIGIDRVILADHLPYGMAEVKAIFLLNVFHHLANPEGFLKEAERVLAPGGCLMMIEPFNSLWGRLFYKYLHHEPFDEKALEW